MKNVTTFCLALATLLTISSCKQQPTLTYQHADKDYNVVCGTTDMKLLKEALYSFENDITKYYNKTGKDTYRSYRSFVNEAIYNRAQNQDIVSAHTIAVFNALKAQPNLWNGKSLNYNSPIIKCIGENIKNNDLKTTFNALIATNSMNAKLFGAPLRSQTRGLTKDKYLATFVALDLFYSKLFDIDFAKVQADKKAKEEAKNKEAKQLEKEASTKDPHAGHNHKPGEKHF